MLGSPLSSLLVVVGRRGAARSLSSLSPASPYPLPQPSPSSSLPSLTTTELPEAAQLCPHVTTHEQLHR